MLFEERKSGVLLHPTSLPSVYGIGDFGAEARRFVDTLEEAGQSLWQILPLVPIGYGNSPYQSTSAFAGNILLISPDELVEMGLLTEEDLGEIPAFDKERVDYDAVKAYKLPLLHKAYETFCAKADEDMQADFAAFCEKQDMWLADFALFTALQAHFRAERAKGIDEEEYLAFAVDTIDFLTEEQQKDYFESACWNTWSRTLRKRNAASLKKWTRLLADAIEEEKFYQYLFFTQWQALKAYANEKGISIMGDTPIFMAYDSADVWANQKLFQLDSMGFPTVVAGVPPDYFCAEGQLWGNPLYDWKAHKKTGYLWWTERIHKALEDVDYLRIDHFRAFESHWEVKFGAENAIVGEWKKGPGMDFFKTIEKTLGKLPLIAEDLGIITDEVRALREEAGFPGMRVLQFAFGNDKTMLTCPTAVTKTASCTPAPTTTTPHGLVRNCHRSRKRSLPPLSERRRQRCGLGLHPHGFCLSCGICHCACAGRAESGRQPPHEPSRYCRRQLGLPFRLEPVGGRLYPWFAVSGRTVRQMCGKRKQRLLMT